MATEELRSGERKTSELELPKGKSCKGCLYYSSILRSQGRTPRCIGVPRTLKTELASNLVGESEIEASKEGRNLSDFRYFCAGYSVYLENKEIPTERQVKKAELPFCVGIEVLVDRRVQTAGNVPAHARGREGVLDGQVLSQPKPYKPPPSMGEEFLNRFTRNAGLVASGVARNMQRVGNHIKDSLEDILYRRPK